MIGNRGSFTTSKTAYTSGVPIMLSRIYGVVKIVLVPIFNWAHPKILIWSSNRFNVKYAGLSL